MVTVREQVAQRIDTHARWLDENPQFGGLDELIQWVSQDYPENEEKIFITKKLLFSPAFRSLSRVGIFVYLYFLEKRFMKRVKRDKKKVWVIENNGKIVFSYQEAEKRGISRSQFVKAIDELQAKGFIDIKHQGKGGQKPAKGTGDVSTYWIDDRWKDYGTDDFRPPRNPRKKDNRKGRGFALIWQKREQGEAMNKKAHATLKRKKLSIENDTR